MEEEDEECRRFWNLESGVRIKTKMRKKERREGKMNVENLLLL
jgi:hypothetical protein